MPAIREELVTSAISFLQDPSVANAPLDKKVAFLESKNLTKQEVDAALARVADPNAAAVTTTSTSSAIAAPASQYQYRSAPPQQQQQQQYGGFQNGYWPEPPKPELPKRDWRDWFIMSTVLGGVGYGLYFTAKRYIIPKIAPPTPDQLTKDKEAIDADFQKAFALLEQLSTDTDALKTAEEQRTTRLDTALTELETVLSGLKEADRKREDDAKRNTDEIRSLRDLIPQALDQQKRSTEERLKDLGSELRSLKTLVGNRMQAPPPAPTPAPAAQPTPTVSAAPAVQPPTTNGVNGSSSTPNYQPPSVSMPANGLSSSSRPLSTHKPTTSSGSNGINGSVPGISTTGRASPAPASPAKTDAAPVTTPAVENVAATERPASSFGSRFGSGGSAKIPAWQMAAAKKAAESSSAEAAPAVEAEASAAA